MSERILDQRSFKRFLFRSVVWPIFLMVGLCIVLVWQIMALIDASSAVARSDMAISQLNQLVKDHIDLETGVRGFLITGKDAFLEPYESARNDVDPQTLQADKLLVDPAQKARLKQITALRAQWIPYAENLIDIRRGKVRGGLAIGRHRRAWQSDHGPHPNGV